MHQFLKRLKDKLEEIKSTDKNFSLPLFLDFVSALYHKLMNNAPFGEYLKKTLIVFFSPEVLQNRIEKFKGQKITQVIISGINIDLKASNAKQINVILEANYVREYKGIHLNYYVKELWILKREKTLSPGAEKMQALVCPVCSAPADFTSAGVCNY